MQKDKMSVNEIIAVVVILIIFIFFIITDEMISKEPSPSDRCTWCLKTREVCRGHGYPE